MAKKLFELLVTEPQLKSQAQTTLTELRTSFEKKRHLFEEKRRTFTSNEEGAQSVVEEQSDIQTSVVDELKWISDILKKAWDTSFQVAEGNTSARANVVLDDQTELLTDVPATALLELEKRIGEFQTLLKAVPTLDPAKGFKADDTHLMKHVFKARDRVHPRTKKDTKVITLAPATVEHPAQAQLVPEDRIVGTIMEQEWSSLITPSRKGDLIERTEELRRALKAALHRANSLELAPTPKTCADKLFGYLLKE